MGLDFGIQKRRKGENYVGLSWEDAHDSWRNCHEVKRIFKDTIEFDDTYNYPISIGAMQILINKLSEELQKVDACIGLLFSDGSYFVGCGSNFCIGRI